MAFRSPMSPSAASHKATAWESSHGGIRTRATDLRGRLGSTTMMVIASAKRLPSAQARVSNSESLFGWGSPSAPLCGARSVMITVRMALMVMAATVRYPVPGGSSQSRSLKGALLRLPNPDHGQRKESRPLDRHRHHREERVIFSSLRPLRRLRDEAQQHRYAWRLTFPGEVADGVGTEPSAAEAAAIR